MSFYSTYDLTDLVRDDGIKTFHAREIATGRPVLVHLLTRPESLEMQALLKKIANLAAEARAQILAEGDHEGTPYIVTAPITAYPGFREWLISQKSAAEPGPAAPPVQSPGSPGPPPIAQDDPFAALFKKTNAPEPPPTRPVRASTEAFRHLIETPTSKKPTMQPEPPAAAGPGPEGSRFMSSGDYLAGFDKQQAAGAAPGMNAPPKDSGTGAAPGEFTRMFQAPSLSSSDPGPGQRSGEFTRMFQTPAAAPPPAAPLPETQSGPGEFTRSFQASTAPPPAPSSNQPFPPTTAKIASAPQEQVYADPAAPAHEAGEFTRMFQAGGGRPAPPSSQAPPPPSQPAPSVRPQESGEFTRMFQKDALSSAPSAPQPPQVPPVPAHEPGEITRMFRTDAKPPAQTSPQPPPVPGMQPQGGGDFTRMFHATGKPGEPPPPPAGVPPPPPSPRSTAPQGGSEFTRMFSAQPGQAPPPSGRQAPEGGEFTRMFTAPPGAESGRPPTPTAPYPRQSAGEFPGQPAGQSQKSKEAGEFTRMFDSPLHPGALAPGQGAADPFAGREHQPAQQQGAPVGEFTNMFGPGNKTPPIAPMGPPTPRSPGADRATNVFKTPQPPGAGNFGSPGQGGGPSLGQGGYTGMMAKPTAGVLAAAAATVEPEKKSFFKTYLPVILFFGAMLVVLVIILIIFSMRKH